MTHRHLAFEQQQRLMRDHGVPKSPLPTLLNTFGLVLGSGDVERIHKEAQAMLSAWSSSGRDRVKNIPIWGRAQYSDDFSQWKKELTKAQLRIVEYVTVHEGLDGELLRTFHRAIVLYLPKQDPWMVAWSGKGPPPPPPATPPPWL